MEAPYVCPVVSQGPRYVVEDRTCPCKLVGHEGAHSVLRILAVLDTWVPDGHWSLVRTYWQEEGEPWRVQDRYTVQPWTPATRDATNERAARVRAQIERQRRARCALEAVRW